MRHREVVTNPLRVLVVSNMLPSATAPQYGVFVVRQTAALQQAGCVVELVGLQRSVGGRFDLPARYLGLERSTTCSADRFRPDVILAHYLMPTGLIARRVARRLRVPYVLTAHGGDVTHAERSRPLRAATRIAVSGAITVIAVSQDLGDRLTALYPGLQPEVIDMGVDRALFHPGTGDLSSFGPPPSRPLVVQVGNLIERKNPERLARAVERLHNERGGGELWIAGDGPLADQLRGLPHVRLLGAVAPERIPDLLRGADVAALVALSEGYGLGALEAVACGVPLVVSQAAPVARDLPASAAVVVDPHSEDAILAGLRAGLALARDDPAGQLAADAHADVVQARRLADLLRRVARWS